MQLFPKEVSFEKKILEHPSHGQQLALAGEMWQERCQLPWEPTGCGGAVMPSAGSQVRKTHVVTAPMVSAFLLLLLP